MTTLPPEAAQLATVIVSISQKTDISGFDLTNALAIAATSHGVGILKDFNFRSEAMARGVMENYKTAFCEAIDGHFAKLVDAGILTADTSDE